MNAGRMLTCAIAMSLIVGATAMATPTRHPVVRLAEVEIDPAQIDRYKVLLKEEIETSIKTEAGVTSLSAVSLRGHSESIRILEVYASDQAYESHLRSPHFLRYKTQTANMIRSLNLLETDPIAFYSK